jgi:hypothetical protein
MKTTTVLITVLTALCLAACGDDDEPAAAEATATPSPAFGVYTREVTDADIERTMEARNDAGGFEPAPSGRWQLTIAPGAGVDVVKVTDPEGFTIEMDARVDGNQLRLVAYSAPEKGAFCDQAIAASAKYELAVRDSAIALKPSADECADRDSVLTGTWTRG